MSIVQRIKSIEEEINRTQKNKATEYHLGLLKAKLARFRAELIEIDSKKSGGGGAGFEAKKSGDARAVLIGFPSVGKSTLLNKITKTASAVAAYEYTTLTSIPGVLTYNGADIQIVDLPGIIEGAASGKGRGRQVIATARTADLVIMLCDANKGHAHKKLLTNELETFGLRLNQKPPKIYYKVRGKSATGKGGISFNTSVAQTKGVDEKLVKEIFHSYKIHNAEIVLSEDVTVDEFIDVIENKAVYTPCLYVYNKVDQITIEELSDLALQDDSIVISCEMDLNLDELIERIWEKLDLVRIYHKKKGAAPDFEEPSIFRSGCTVKDACERIHQDMVGKFKYANVWGRSAKHDSQTVGLSHELCDEDVLQIVADL